jgi:hypothetical protein
MRANIMGDFADILDRGVPIQAALEKAQRSIQNLLDEALRTAR